MKCWMKLLFGMIILFLSGCAGLEQIKDADRTFERIVEAPGYSKEQIFNGTKIWIAENFKSAKAVLIFIGNVAGQRALYLQILKVTDRAALEFSNCRRAFMVAKGIFDSFNDEIGSANALFNLANQIRFFGEVKEALELAIDSLAVAKKYKNHMLQQKAQWLIETLEKGIIPNYVAGERRV